MTDVNRSDLFNSHRAASTVPTDAQFAKAVALHKSRGNVTPVKASPVMKVVTIASLVLFPVLSGLAALERQVNANMYAEQAYAKTDAGKAAASTAAFNADNANKNPQVYAAVQAYKATLMVDGKLKSVTDSYSGSGCTAEYYLGDAAPLTLCAAGDKRYTDTTNIYTGSREVTLCVYSGESDVEGGGFKQYSVYSSISGCLTLLADLNGDVSSEGYSYGTNDYRN